MFNCDIQKNFYRMITKNFSKSLLRLLALAVLVAVPSVSHAAAASGDVNGDGEINITDISALIDAMFSGEYSVEADVNGDGEITINDINKVIDSILNGPHGEEQPGDWVDLGLPSGTIWATRNVGASAPEDFGDHFAWGETAPKSYYDWNTYKWYQEYQDADGYWHSGYTKYCTQSGYGLDGFVDNKTELDPSDDAACAHYPGGRMPSSEQILELVDNCIWTWTQRNGVNGQLVTGPNGNTMFLPAAGYRWYESLDFAGSRGSFWSRMLNSGDPHGAYDLYFYSGGWGYWGYSIRGYGRTVRAVRVL